MDALQTPEPGRNNPELRAAARQKSTSSARHGTCRLLLSTPDLRRPRPVDANGGRAGQARSRPRRRRTQTARRSSKARAALLNARRGARRPCAARAEGAGRGAARRAGAQLDLIRDIDQRRDLNAQLAGELQADPAEAAGDAARAWPTARPPGDTAALPFRPFRGDARLAGGRRRRAAGSAAARRRTASRSPAPRRRRGAAVHDGVVAFAGTVLPDSGIWSSWTTDRQTFSLYGDLLEITVKKGARDRARAARSSTARPDARRAPDGLYFELRVDGQPVDPLQWLKKR